MSGSFFSLMLNGVIIVLLGATIVYAGRLSMHIKVFRDSRKDLDRLIKDLGKQIEKADASVAAMKAAARDAGKELQRQIDHGRALSDELQLMTESGNSLAKRLEKGSERPKAPQKPPMRAPEAPLKERGRDVPAPAFAIRDSEFGREDEDQGLDDAAFQSDGNLHSRAERELYDALRKRRKGMPL